jgi:ribosomal-protein-alanine N-acetyltransferase
VNTLPVAFPVLKTQRLVLREIVPNDTERLFHYYSDTAVTEFFMSPIKRLEEAKEIVDSFIGSFYQQRGLLWGLSETPTSPLIGTAGYEAISVYDSRVEIGYDLAKDYWGRGLMKEALKEILRYSFDVLAINRIEAFILFENARSIKTLERLGFTREGVLCQHRLFCGRFRDDIMMALLKQDWERNTVRPGV